jgi:hypothetical protein
MEWTGLELALEKARPANMLADIIASRFRISSGSLVARTRFGESGLMASDAFMSVIADEAAETKASIP